jgi:hypothetical protein
VEVLGVVGAVSSPHAEAKNAVASHRATEIRRVNVAALMGV